MRSAGHLEIPIGRAPPNSALPPRGFLLARLSNASPRRLAQPSCKGPASETLQHYPHMLPTEEARLRRWPRHNCAPSGCAPTHAICWPPRNPHRPRPTKQRPSSPRFSSLRGFRTPAPGGSPNRRARGRRPKPFSISADLVTSEDPLRPLRQRQTRTCSRPKRLVFVAGPVTTARRRAARRRMRSAGHLEIPIGRAPPNSALPPRGFLLARLSNASPRRLAQPSCKGPASETLQH